MTVTAATVLFLTPAAYHRLTGHQDGRGRLRFGVKTTLIGLLLLVLSVTCAVFVVVRFLFDSSTLGALMAAATAMLTFTMWYLLPLLRRQHSGEASEKQSET